VGARIKGSAGDREPEVKILWVKAGGLVPLDTGGKIRSFHILRELARRHKVTIFTFYAAHTGDIHGELEREFTQVECCPIRLPRARGVAEALRYGRSLFSGVPYSIAKYHRREIAVRLRRLVEAKSYDAIVCDFVFAATVIPWHLPLPKVFFAHNVEALIWKRHCQVARNPIWKAVCRREYHLMDRAERTYVGLANHVLTVSEFDRQVFSRFVDRGKITVVPTGVDVEFFRPESGPEEPANLVFTGSMDWMPNEDGILYFVNEILPRIRQQVPQATLWVVGRRPSRRLRELEARMQGLHVTGAVDDIRPFVHRSALYIVPLRVGGGTRLKIYEAMAMGKAVVSTALGAEGLPVENGENIVLADQPAEFANQVVRLLNNPEKRAGLGRAARALVQEKHSWRSVAAIFDEVLNHIVESRKTDSDPVGAPVSNR
jgi:polysaccharide biosynthesis protein PslH